MKASIYESHGMEKLKHLHGKLKLTPETMEESHDIGLLVADLAGMGAIYTTTKPSDVRSLFIELAAQSTQSTGDQDDE